MEGWATLRDGGTMIHAKVDVSLRDHVRAHKAGAAMGTWTWGLLYVREHETDGHVPDIAIRLAWVGERDARRDAAKLVEVGLWTKHQDGDGWMICKYDAKNETRAVIDVRRKETRERVAKHRASNHSRNALPNALHGVLVPGSGSDSGSDSEISLGSERADQSPREGSPAPVKPVPTATAPSEPLFAAGTAGALEARERFEHAVAAATGRPFALGRAPFHGNDLCTVLNGHGPATGLLDALAWLDGAVADWVAAQDGKHPGGWAPGKLLDWLNGGRVDRRASRARGTHILQPEVPGSWVMPEGFPS